MTDAPAAPPRCAVLVGNYTSGKTSLLEAMLHTAGAIDRQGTVAQKNTVGDSSREARERQMSVEPNVAEATFLGDAWSLIDCPGSVELMQDARTCLMAADVAVVVAEPEPDKAVTLAPLFKFLDDYQIPHMLFVNKMDKAGTSAREMMAALQAVSSRPLMLRQVPIRDGEAVTGYVDLVSERAYRYQDGKPSELIKMPDTIRDREGEARQEMLESLADFDDELLEKLLEDVIPAPDEIYGQLTKDLEQDLIVPVLLGSADKDNGVTRLWKALRHETPGPERTAARLGVLDAAGEAGKDLAATVAKTFHQAHTGKLSLARVWRGSIKDGMTIAGHRLSGIYHLMGSDQRKVGEAKAGELVALARIDDLQTGDLITGKGKVEAPDIVWPQPAEPVYAFAVQPEKREDEVKLTTAIHKLMEEDPSLQLAHDEATGQMQLWGQGEIHLQLAVERLKSKYNVAVTTQRPMTAYKETIRKPTKYHARFKRQTGGHGQFADIHVEIKPKERGAGFEFTNSVVGGAVPKQFIPAVEHGVKEALQRGPLGFPVVDLSVNLYDGQHHSVDSSDQAFKTAGRIAMTESLPDCEPVLLEPVYQVTISVPQDYTNKVHGLVSGRRGQILGFEAKPGWQGWDELKAFMPGSELPDLIVELRSLTLGVGFFEKTFDHLNELSGKLADRVIQERQDAAQ
ncbi:elongation factor G [Ferruginivarius sediminum]|uniref:Elongation factor G n=1 Tax=Ferruginivarius sediminum TaxID=2661937 RepID=A0A369T8Q1_9PROT|nr:elongation factor G [Ferruginivarius sediminum]RDD61272.1 elongation factor G [Ferruginivarius sediminum]